MNSQFERGEWSELEKAIKDATEIKTPEMTVDLPHEQKLTFGNLKPNTIVEIATWQGTGAPNESSVRMLIGASLQPTDDNLEIVGQVPGDLAIPEVPASPEVTAQEAVIPSKEKTRFPGFSKKAPPPETEYQKINPELSWVLIREAQKMGVTPFKQELTRKNMRVKKMKKPAKTVWAITLASIAGIGLIIGGLNVSGTLAFDHPQVGPELPFGSATSSLIAIVPNSEPAEGELAMATIDGKRNLVRVESENNGSFTIATMAGSMDVTMEEINGKVAFVIPFLGALWSVVGQ
jgi:hypothetical protein